MKYALNLAEDNRILSAWVVLENGNYDGMPFVDELPDGDVSDYLYQDGQYVYAPRPKPQPGESEPTTDELLNAMLGVNRYE